MSDVTRVSDQALEWNVLTGRWIETMPNEGGARDCSPLEALKEANTFRCIAAANALDLFAAHRTTPFDDICLPDPSRAGLC